MTSPARIEPWTIGGSDGEPILGDAHLPQGEPRAVVLIAHGFKGYKDYGMFPAIARALASSGVIAHRFNFSHSGMTEKIDTFARPDLFERDTWNRQVDDLRAVFEAVAAGDLHGRGLPVVLFGHSRGGVTCLLYAGRHAGDPAAPQPAGVATASAPSSACNLSDDEKRQLREAGFLESPSSRTGQVLRIGPAWLEEQEADPGAHDVLSIVGRIECPILVVHGEDDPTVPIDSAEEIAAGARRVTLVRIPGGDHVFNTPNPMPPSETPGPQLSLLLRELSEFVETCRLG